MIKKQLGTFLCPLYEVTHGYNLHMGKINKILVNNQTKSEEIALPSVNKLSVVAKTNSLHLSSFGGMPILKEAEKRLALASQLASLYNLFISNAKDTSIYQQGEYDKPRFVHDTRLDSY